MSKLREGMRLSGSGFYGISGLAEKAYRSQDFDNNPLATREASVEHIHALAESSILGFEESSSVSLSAAEKRLKKMKDKNESDRSRMEALRKEHEGEVNRWSEWAELGLNREVVVPDIPIPVVYGMAIVLFLIDIVTLNRPVRFMLPDIQTDFLSESLTYWLLSCLFATPLFFLSWSLGSQLKKEVVNRKKSNLLARLDEADVSYDTGLKIVPTSSMPSILVTLLIVIVYAGWLVLIRIQGLSGGATIAEIPILGLQVMVPVFVVLAEYISSNPFNPKPPRAVHKWEEQENNITSLEQRIRATEQRKAERLESMRGPRVLTEVANLDTSLEKRGIRITDQVKDRTYIRLQNSPNVNMKEFTSNANDS